MVVNYKPAGCQSVIPYLIITDADEELRFVKEVFHAKETHVSRNSEGRIMHAQVEIGDSVVMMGEAGEQWPAIPASIYIYVPDVDAAYKRALASGATSIREPADQFYGDRNCGVKGPNGVQWWITTHIEDVSEEELQRRMANASKRQA